MQQLLEQCFVLRYLTASCPLQHIWYFRTSLCCRQHKILCHRAFLNLARIITIVCFDYSNNCWRPPFPQFSAIKHFVKRFSRLYTQIQFFILFITCWVDRGRQLVIIMASSRIQRDNFAFWACFFLFDDFGAIWRRHIRLILNRYGQVSFFDLRCLLLLLRLFINTSVSFKLLAQQSKHSGGAIFRPLIINFPIYMRDYILFLLICKLLSLFVFWCCRLGWLILSSFWKYIILRNRIEARRRLIG